MNILQSLLDEELEKHPIRLVVDVVERKLREKGVHLTSRQRRRFEKALTRTGDEPVALRAGRPWQRGTVDLEITDADLEGLQDRIESWLEESVPRVMGVMSNKVAIELLKTFKDRFPAHWRYERKVASRFGQRLERRWREPFRLLRMLVAISTDFGSETSQRVHQNRPTELVSIQLRLHARSCQVAREVLRLLESGFADGAMARWRTLHEIAVVAMLLSNGGDKLAERYRLHETVESRRAAREYMKYTTQLGLEPFDPSEIADLDKEHDKLLERFGKTFGNQYGWAADHVKSARPTFADLERAAGIDHLRPYYRMASHNVHANPKGAFFSLGIIDEFDLNLAGPSNYGLADPGQSTALSLVHTIVALAMSDLTFDGLVVMKLAWEVSHEIAETFVSVQHDLEEEEATRHRG